MNTRLITAFLLTLAIGCGDSSTIPLVTPPVRAATPAALRPVGAPRLDVGPTTIVEELQMRFFSGMGPTDLFSVLKTVDDRIKDINSRKTTSGCLTQTPVAYSITPFGQTVPFFAQCSDQGTASFPGDPAFVQWATTDDGKTYLYTAMGAERIAAILTPIDAAAGTYQVHIWLGVGYSNAMAAACTNLFDGCSYGVVELSSDSSAARFEMAIAGAGMGFCGAQMKSDGSVVYFTGSRDMSATCNALENACVNAADLSAAASCTSAMTFDLAPLGRKASGTHSMGASLYPATPNITLDGTTSDSLYFGPTAPTAGVGKF
jgi:hypothetical protein